MTQHSDPNLKSPVFVKLETMIETIAMFRQEMEGQRIPKFEETFIQRKHEMEQKRLRDARRKTRVMNFGPGGVRAGMDDSSRH